MIALIVVGVISLLMGYLYLFRPESIIKLSSIGNRLVTTDHELIRFRLISGILMILAGGLMFIVGMNYL